MTRLEGHMCLTAYRQSYAKETNQKRSEIMFLSNAFVAAQSLNLRLDPIVVLGDVISYGLECRYVLEGLQDEWPSRLGTKDHSQVFE